MATPEEALATMRSNLKQKTGKTLPQWLKLVKASKLEKHGQIVKLLKADHEVTHGFANLIAHEALDSLTPGSAQSKPGDLVEKQYSGKKSAVRPIYEALLKVITKLGKDVEVSPKKAYVSLRRNKQFALIQPSTATRVDVGFCMKGEPTTARLEASGSFNSMCSHRVRISSIKDIDAELKRWLKQAYQVT